MRRKRRDELCHIWEVTSEVTLHVVAVTPALTVIAMTLLGMIMMSWQPLSLDISLSSDSRDGEPRLQLLPPWTRGAVSRMRKISPSYRRGLPSDLNLKVLNKIKIHRPVHESRTTGSSVAEASWWERKGLGRRNGVRPGRKAVWPATEMSTRCLRWSLLPIYTLKRSRRKIGKKRKL